MPEINWIAVVVAAVACFLLGGLWYSPVLFGKAWQREAGLTDEQLKNGNMVKIFGLSLVLVAARRVELRELPRAPAVDRVWRRRRLFGRPVVGGGQLRHQLSIRAQEPEAVPDQRRLSHAAVHHHRPGSRAAALHGLRANALPVNESRAQSRPRGQRRLLQERHRQVTCRMVQGARQTRRRRPRTPRLEPLAHGRRKDRTVVELDHRQRIRDRARRSRQGRQTQGLFHLPDQEHQGERQGLLRRVRLAQGARRLVRSETRPRPARRRPLAQRRWQSSHDQEGERRQEHPVSSPKTKASRCRRRSRSSSRARATNAR